MNRGEVFELPPIIPKKYYEDVDNYLEAVYNIFKRDFIDSRPIFEGVKLGLKCHPLVNGKECIFYHITTKGEDETNRELDFARLERIPYPKPIIDNSKHPYLKVWRNKRKGKNRILIYHEAESYLVVLEDRVSYILPWTAYIVEYNNKKQRLLKEYECYIKSQNRPV